MTYLNLKNHFDAHRVTPEFTSACMSHIEDMNTNIEFDNDLFTLCDYLKANDSIEFYQMFESFFNGYKPDEGIDSIKFKTYTIKTLMCMATSVNSLMKYGNTIRAAFYIIHSVFDYGIDSEIPFVNHPETTPETFSILLSNSSFLSPNMNQIVNLFLAHMVHYAKKFNTEYGLIDNILHNLHVYPNLLKNITNDTFVDFLAHTLEWCSQNKHDDEKMYFEILKEISNKTTSDEVNLRAELCLYRFYPKFDLNYNHGSLVVFYDKNSSNMHLVDKLRVLTELFLYVDEEKYFQLFLNELTQLNNNELINDIENLYPKVYSAFLTKVLIKNNDFLYNLLCNTYDCSRDVIASTAFYLHSDNETYIIESAVHKIDYENLEEHKNIIAYQNEIFNLGITVLGDSINQKIISENQLHRENIPLDTQKNTELKLIKSLENYYHIHEFKPSDNIKYIQVFQHLRVPLQQLLLKKHDRLFPLVKVINKDEFPKIKTKRVLYAALSESSTIKMDEEVVENLNNDCDLISYEYKNISDKQELLKILECDDYDVIVLTSHGEVDTREALNNHIKIGESYMSISDFKDIKQISKTQRLLYLNICDSGHYALKQGFLLESLSTYLTNSNQATVSHMWPVEQKYSSVFLMIFLKHLSSEINFKEAYASTLLLAIHNKLDKYIQENELFKLELFRLFYDSGINKNSIVHWGSTLYQE